MSYSDTAWVDSFSLITSTRNFADIVEANRSRYSSKSMRLRFGSLRSQSLRINSLVISIASMVKLAMFSSLNPVVPVPEDCLGEIQFSCLANKWQMSLGAVVVKLL